jgi:hypothetical protein
MVLYSFVRFGENEMMAAESEERGKTTIFSFYSRSILAPLDHWHLLRKQDKL